MQDLITPGQTIMLQNTNCRFGVSLEDYQKMTAIVENDKLYAVKEIDDLIIATATKLFEDDGTQVDSIYLKSINNKIRLYKNSNNQLLHETQSQAGKIRFLVLTENNTNKKVSYITLFDQSLGTADMQNISNSQALKQAFPTLKFMQRYSYEYSLFKFTTNRNYSIILYEINTTDNIKRWEATSYKEKTFYQTKNISNTYDFDNAITKLDEKYGISFYNSDESIGIINKTSGNKKVLINIEEGHENLSVEKRFIQSESDVIVPYSDYEQRSIDRLNYAAPVGTVIHLYKFNNQVNGDIKKYYLKMDGSRIPFKPEYAKLIKLFGGRYVPDNKYKVYRPKNGKVIWFLRNKSIKEYIDESEFNDGYNITGTETVTLNERYWNGYSFYNVTGNIISNCNSLLGTSDRAVADGNAVCTMVNTTLMSAGNYYYSQYSSGLTTPSFSINDKISVGYCQISGNNCLFTIYNHTTNQYLISGTSSSNTYENFEFYQRNYDSILINGYISNGQRVFIGFGSSTSSDSTMVGDDQDKSAYVTYSFHNNIYLPDMTSNDVFLGGGSSSGSYNRANLPNIKGELGRNNVQPNLNWGQIMWNFGLNNKTEIGDGPNFKFQRSGAFKKSAVNGDTLPNGQTYSGYNNQLYYDANPNAGIYIVLDASASNSTYNNSNRVNPNYYVVEFWIKFK